MLKKTLGALLLLLVGGLCWLYAAGSGWLGTEEVDGEMTQTPRSEETKSEFASAQSKTASDLGVDEPKQILFGDFHVHTTFSFDAFLQNLPVAGGAGTRPPSDACDFARYCSALDFWSINDHALSLTPDRWAETIASVRECQEIAGAGDQPDLVSFLGWEWTQMGTNPDNHYGHKNVVFRGLDDDKLQCWIALDEASLVSIFDRLCENAEQHAASTVRIQAKREAEFLQLDFADDGNGIDLDDPDKIFDRGFTANHKGGTGLGLAIVRRLLERYGGSIRYLHDSIGAHFRLHLPLNPSPPIRLERGDETVPGP